MSSKYLVLIISSLGLGLLTSCGPGSTSNLRQNALIGEETEEEEITAERPAVIAGSHLQVDCNEQVSSQMFKKVVCKISEEIDLDTLDLENLTVRVNERQIPITVSPEGDFEIVVAKDEKVDSSTLIVMDQIAGPASHNGPHGDGQATAGQAGSEDGLAAGDDQQEESSEQGTTGMEQPVATNTTTAPDDISSKNLKDGLKSEKGINIASFIDNEDPSVIFEYDRRYESNTFDIYDKDRKGKDELEYSDFNLPDLTEPTAFRIEAHNTTMSKGVILKINDSVFGGDHTPQVVAPDKLYSSANSGLDFITTLKSLSLVFSEDVNKGDDTTVWAPEPECPDLEASADAVKAGAFTIKFIEITDEGDKLHSEISLYADTRGCDEEDDKGKNKGK